LSAAISARDLAALQPGDRLPGFTTPPITGLTLALFAGGTGDHNPIHVDPAFARANGFADVFAHGMLSMAYLGRLLTGWVGPRRLRSFQVRFAAITPIGAEVTCSGEVLALIDDGGERRARVALTAALPDGTVTLSGDAVVVLG